MADAATAGDSKTTVGATTAGGSRVMVDAATAADSSTMVDVATTGGSSTTDGDNRATAEAAFVFRANHFY